MRMNHRFIFVIISAISLSFLGCATANRALTYYPPPIYETKPTRLEVPPPVPPPIIAAPRPRALPLDSRTVVVDAGHGGQDPGALGVGPQPEKVVNLSISRYLCELLASAGARVKSTRTTDRFIPLDTRADLAEQWDADLFVSIHSDASPDANVTGATVYVARDASPESLNAAQNVVSAFERSGIKCRGIRRAGFRVLVGHSRPAVLVECGYLTNYYESRRLSSPAYQAMLAAALMEGIGHHFSRYD